MRRPRDRRPRSNPFYEETYREKWLAIVLDPERIEKYMESLGDRKFRKVVRQFGWDV